jgi:uncharacterized membrane-anchored protein YjiN (DUF445 family)
MSDGPVIPVGPDADQARRRGLRRMKALALALLLLAAMVYALTLGARGWVGFVNTAAEAAMVGALADWFAVTALFRRPLGLPIPHTALIPTRKDALGRSLQEFVGTNFLAEQVVRERVARARIAHRLGAWLAGERHAERVTAELATATRGALRVLRDDEVATLLEDVVLRPVLARPWGPPAGRLLDRIVTDGAHHRLVDLTVVELEAWLREHEDLVTQLVLDRAPLWTPQWLDDRVARRAYVEALKWVVDVRDTPRHRARLALDDALGRFAKDLQTDPATIARAEALKERVVGHPGVREALESLWATARAVLIEATEDPDSDLRRRTRDGLLAFGRRLATDAELQGKVDSYVGDAVGHLVTTYRDEVTTVITETVERWDGDEASRRIELHVGRDLQFIRINGTVVGALAGLAIHTVTVLSGQA